MISAVKNRGVEYKPSIGKLAYNPTSGLIKALAKIICLSKLN